MQLVVNAVVAAAIAHVLLGQIVLRLPLWCHVMSVCRRTCNFVFGCEGAYPKEDEIMSDKPQIGKEKEKEGYQPYMEDTPASMPVS